MRTVFADAYFYIALLDPHDAVHEEALVCCTDATLKTFVTTPWVLLEVANMLAGSKARNSCAALLRDLHADPATRILPADSRTFDRGPDFYEKRPDKTWSLTDCISFVVMSDEGLTEALTGDHHFEQAGFTALLRTRA